MPSVGTDLIFGLPGRTVQDATAELRELPLGGLSHLSVYALTIEPNTHFGALSRAGRLPMAPDELVTDTFFALHEAISSEHYEHYEISNYARPGHRSVHNMGYWRGSDYLGLGVAAWGTVTIGCDPIGGTTRRDRVRYRNTTQIQQYLDLTTLREPDSVWSLQPGGLVAELETISDSTALTERLMLGLRTSDGVDLDILAESLDVRSWLSGRQTSIDKLVQRRRLVREGSKLKIPFEAWFLADGTIAELI